MPSPIVPDEHIPSPTVLNEHKGKHFCSIRMNRVVIQYQIITKLYFSTQGELDQVPGGGAL
jgi:hypothetical protein